MSQNVNLFKQKSNISEKYSLNEDEKFMELKSFAERFVDKTLKRAVNVLQKEEINKCEVDKSMKEIINDVIDKIPICESDLESKHIWPKCEEFTIAIGKLHIKDFVCTWKLEHDWLFCIDFIGSQKDSCSEYFLYEVKWSIPTKKYPVPQATASVFFELESSFVRPSHLAIGVTYIFEGNRYQHKPGRLDFQEAFLFNIIENKLALFKRILF